MGSKSVCCVNLSIICVFVLVFSNLEFVVSTQLLPGEGVIVTKQTSENTTTSAPPAPVTCEPRRLADGSPTSECKNLSPPLDLKSTPVNTTPSGQLSEVDNLNSRSYTGGDDVDEAESGNLQPTTKSMNVKEKGNKSEKISNSTSSEIKQNLDTASDVMDMVSKRRNESTIATAIAAGLCAVLAVSAYGGILIWRKISRVHFGNQEELINDDDLDDTNDADLHHFELKLLSREGRVIET